MAVLDPFNPRSVAFQVENSTAISPNCRSLADDGMLEAPRRLIVQLTADISTAVADKLDVNRILMFEKRCSPSQKRSRHAISCKARMWRGPNRERSGVIYDIKHVTTYEYGSTVTFNYCALRLLPQDGPGQRGSKRGC